MFINQINMSETVVKGGLPPSISLRSVRECLLTRPVTLTLTSDPWLLTMARGAGVLPVKKKSAGVKQSGDKNSDITVYAEENFGGNSQIFEISNKDFKTNFDVNFKEPVKSIIISGITWEI